VHTTLGDSRTRLQMLRSSTPAILQKTANATYYPALPFEKVPYYSEEGASLDLAPRETLVYNRRHTPLPTAPESADVHHEVLHRLLQMRVMTELPDCTAEV
jgi:hypothetical protein